MCVCVCVCVCVHHAFDTHNCVGIIGFFFQANKETKQKRGKTGKTTTKKKKEVGNGGGGGGRGWWGGGGEGWDPACY